VTVAFPALWFSIFNLGGDMTYINWSISYFDLSDVSCMRFEQMVKILFRPASRQPATACIYLVI